MVERGSSRMRLAGFLKKETIQILRDPSSLLLGIVMPVVLLFIFGYGVSLDPKNVPVAMVLQDSGPEARELAARFELSPYFKPQTVYSVAEAKEMVDSGEVDGILIADSGSTPSATHVLFANVLVTNVQFDETPVTLNDDEESNLASAPTSALLVTVALSPSDAERLVFATTFGTLWFATEGSAVTADGTSIQTRGSIFSGRAPELVETLPAESAEEEG